MCEHKMNFEDFFYAKNVKIWISKRSRELKNFYTVKKYFFYPTRARAQNRKNSGQYAYKVI